MLIVQDVLDLLLGSNVLSLLGTELLSHFLYYFFYYRDLVFANHYAFEFVLLHLLEPFMLLQFLDSDSRVRVSVQESLDEVFALRRDEARDQVVASQDLLIQFICVWVFEGQVTTGHGV